MQGTRIMLSARVVFDMTRALTIQDQNKRVQNTSLVVTEC